MTFDSLRESGTATKSGAMARRHCDTDWLPTFVFNTLNRVTVVFAPLFSASHARSRCYGWAL